MWLCWILAALMSWGIRVEATGCERNTYGNYPSCTKCIANAYTPTEGNTHSWACKCLYGYAKDASGACTERCYNINYCEGFGHECVTSSSGSRTCQCAPNYTASSNQHDCYADTVCWRPDICGRGFDDSCTDLGSGSFSCDCPHGTLPASSGKTYRCKPRCTDFMGVSEPKTMDYGYPPTGQGDARTGAVLQDVAADNEFAYYAYYEDICQRRDPSYAGDRPDEDCLVVRKYANMDELLQQNGNGGWTNEVYLNRRCFLKTMIIIHGYVICQEALTSSTTPILIKMSLETGAVFTIRKLWDARDSMLSSSASVLRHASFHMLVDETGLWILYSGSWSGYLELIDPYDLLKIHRRSLSWTPSGQFMMVCGKLYNFQAISGQTNQYTLTAYDFDDTANTYSNPVSFAPNLVRNDAWMHYNPRVKKLFQGWESNNNVVHEVYTCGSRFANPFDRTHFPSTFWWAIEPSSVEPLTQFQSMVTQLDGFINAGDSSVLMDIYKVIYMCPAKKCLDPDYSDSLYCQVKALSNMIRIFAKFKESSASSRKRLQTQYHMKSLLEYTHLETVSTDIANLQNIMQQSFQALQQSMNSFKTQMGDYFFQLANYDQKKSKADVDFIYGRLEDYNLQASDLGDKLEPKLTKLFNGAFASLAGLIANKVRNLAMTIRNALKPDGDGPKDISDAIDELAVAAAETPGLIYLHQNIFPRILEFVSKVQTYMGDNAEHHTAIKEMIYAAENGILDSEEVVPYYEDFLTEYNAYSPMLSEALITEFGTVLDLTIDHLCSQIEDIETTEEAIVKTVFTSQGECINTKIDVETYMAYLSEAYDFQYDLMDAMADYVRANIAKSTANTLRTIEQPVSQNAVLNLQVQALLIKMASETHLSMVIHDACNLIEYKSGGSMPDFCTNCLDNPRHPDFRDIVTFDYDTDMCHYDKVKRVVYIPAAFPWTNRTLAPGTIDLELLYTGGEVIFQVPDSNWLVENDWLSSQDLAHSWYIKLFEVYIPQEEDTHYRVEMKSRLMGGNHIQPGGTDYEFTGPVQWDLRYMENLGACHGTRVENPYDVPGCETRPKICVESHSTGTLVYHPSVFAQWKINATSESTLTRPTPHQNRDFHLRASVKLCKIAANRKKRDLAETREKRAVECCANSNKIFNHHTYACESCPSPSCPKMDGHYCGEC